jgi:hypothetical protein
MTVRASSQHSSGHSSYAEIDTPATMRADAAATGRTLHLDLVARAAAQGAPSLSYADFPREVGKPAIEVVEAAARLAAALNLYLD